MRREPVDVAVLFDASPRVTSASCANAASARSATWTPGAETSIGDPDRLEQALQNLAANALRHTPDGGAISLSGRRRAGRIACASPCATPAQASPPEHLPLIFDRFYKVDAARKAAGGSGLGLSIVKAIVERHGGTISARNDNGAVFEIVLPRRIRGSGVRPRIRVECVTDSWLLGVSRLVVLSRCRQPATERPGSEGLVVDIPR